MGERDGLTGENQCADIKGGLWVRMLRSSVASGILRAFRAFVWRQ